MVGGILICSSKLSGGGEHEGGCCVDVGGRGRWQIGLDGEWNGGGRGNCENDKQITMMRMISG